MATRNGTKGPDTIFGTTKDDRIDARGGRDEVFADSGRDFVRGGSGGDSLSGQDDDDRLFGEDGNDKINGGEGDDSINGGRDDDDIQGDAGDDSMTGGRGRDTFVINLDDGLDTILDFSFRDTISLNGFSQIKSFADLTIDVVGKNSVIDLGFIENNVEGEQVLTILNDTNLTANDFDFSVGPVVVALKSVAPSSPPVTGFSPDKGDTLMGVMGVQGQGFDDIGIA
jgi:Ca2+-binding RTX toxin-like protein